MKYHNWADDILQKITILVSALPFSISSAQNATHCIKHFDLSCLKSPQLNYCGKYIFLSASLVSEGAQEDLFLPSLGNSDTVS